MTTNTETPEMGGTPCPRCTSKTCTGNCTTKTIEKSKKTSAGDVNANYVALFAYNNEEKILLERYACIERPNPYLASSLNTSIDRAKAGQKYAPEKLRALILQASEDFSPPSVLVIKNSPRSAVLPPTPTDGEYRDIKSCYCEESHLFLVATFLGTPVALDTEKAGRTLSWVIPTQSKELFVGNEGSAAHLGAHIELIHTYPNHPDYLALGAIKGDPLNRAETLIYDVRAILPHVPPKYLPILREWSFRVKQPQSCVGAGHAPGWSRQMPVIEGPIGAPQLNFEDTDMIGETPEAEEALAAFRDAISKTIPISLKLEAGDLVVINNRMTIHARTSFKASFDGNDRWLVRCNIRRETWSIREFYSAETHVIKDPTKAYGPSIKTLTQKLMGNGLQIPPSEEEVIKVISEFDLATKTSLPPERMDVLECVYFSTAIAKGMFKIGLNEDERIKFAARFLADQLLEAGIYKEWDATVLGYALCEPRITPNQILALLNPALKK